MAKPTKVLLIYASFGSGHRRAAEALQEVLQERGIPSELQDLVPFLPGPLKSLYPWSYNFLTSRWRWGWKTLYNRVDRPSKPYAPARAQLQRWQFGRLKRYLQDQQFTHIFSTHFTPSALLTDWRDSKEIDAKIYSVVTDHTAHRCWKRTGLDHYFVANEEVVQQLEGSGISKNDITVSGIPVAKAFRKPLPREDARVEWDCEENESVVLALCSGWNLKKTLSILNEISSTGLPLRLLISTGPDPAKEQKVKKRFHTSLKHTIFGFSPRIAELMSAADLMISKPGGLIVSEALAVGLPQLLLSPIPGQEEANAKFAERHGAAICIGNEKGVLGRTLSEVLRQPEKLQAMKEAARKIGSPLAALEIVNRVFAAPASPQGKFMIRR